MLYLPSRLEPVLRMETGFLAWKGHYVIAHVHPVNPDEAMV